MTPLAALLCLAIGYLCGSFLAADIVMRIRTGQSAFEVGSGNPGMANVGAQLGPVWAALVLTGDILKVFLAVFLAGELCAALPVAAPLRAVLLNCPGGIAFPHSGTAATLLAGLGAVLGHDFPFWHGGRGGKGVAATCSALILFNPAFGILAGAIGLAIVAVAHRLQMGALAIVAMFGIEMVIVGAQPLVIGYAGALIVLSVVVWRRGARTPAGQEPNSR